jgi:hypothetical protein
MCLVSRARRVQRMDNAEERGLQGVSESIMRGRGGGREGERWVPCEADEILNVEPCGISGMPVCRHQHPFSRVRTLTWILLQYTPPPPPHTHIHTHTYIPTYIHIHIHYIHSQPQQRVSTQNTRKRQHKYSNTPQLRDRDRGVQHTIGS